MRGNDIIITVGGDPTPPIRRQEPRQLTFADIERLRLAEQKRRAKAERQAKGMRHD